MKKIWLIFLCLATASCIKQTVNTETTFLEHFTFEEVWDASIRAVQDIHFTIDSVDKEAGFIGAESGTFLTQEVPPRLSIMISDGGDRVSIDCRVLQKEQ